MVFGGKAYKIISLSSQNLLNGMDMCDLCPSTKNRTGFVTFRFVSHLLKPLDIYSKNISERIHPVSDFPKIQSGGMLSTTALGGLMYGNTTNGGNMSPDAV